MVFRRKLAATVLVIASAGEVHWVAGDERTAKCSVNGSVMDGKGRPVPFAIVTALRAGFLAPIEQAPSVVTNERGAYCIPPVAAGEYRIRAYTRSKAPSSSPSCVSCCEAATDYTATFHPDTLHLEKARQVSLAPGSSVNRVNIWLRSVPVYCVRGEVRNLSGELIPGAPLRLERMGFGESSGVLTEGGRFLLTNLLPGDYRLALMNQAQLGKVVSWRSFRVKDRNIDGLVLTASWPVLQPLR